LKRNVELLALQGAALVLISVAFICCNSGSNAPKGSMPPQLTASAKRYQLRGKVVSVDKRAGMVNVDGEAIPDLMGAMTMPYNVKPKGELDKLSAGDTITADVLVQDPNYWLENIVVTGHSTSPPSK
jgi:Cu/Ag efflux protein CusF